jgi:hypothetical protein
MELTTQANDSGETAHEELVPGFSAEDDREWAVAFDSDVQRGWAFGVEGPGHPERLVGAHVAAMLRNIGSDDELRPALRFLALVHDSMKWAVRRGAPWSPDNDHAVLARRVAERHTGDPRLLQTLELHDEAYWLFRNKPTEPDALDALLARLPDTELYLRFVELDSRTEGKEPTFLIWLRNELGLRGLLPAGKPEPPDETRGGETIFLMEWATEPELALLRGRTFAQRVVEEVDQTGVRILEARALEPVERRP